MDTKEVLKKNESLENFIRQYTDLISEKIERKPSIDRLENLRLFIAYFFLERIYFNADSLETLREGMFAGKYFDKEAGTFKLVFYPTMGQTSPASK